MEFPESLNQFYYWIVLLVLFLLFIAYRFFTSGLTTPMDIIFVLIFIALLLMPLFGEIGIFGIRLKQDIESLRTDLTGEIINLRSDIYNSIDFKAENTQNIYVNQGSPDEQLIEIEKSGKESLDEILKEKGIDKIYDYPDFKVDSGIKFLFTVRYIIEQETRRIWENHGFGISIDRKYPLGRIADDLFRNQILDNKTRNIFKEVSVICNRAIHGEDVSKTQINFVEEIAPELITILKITK